MWATETHVIRCCKTKWCTLCPRIFIRQEINQCGKVSICRPSDYFRKSPSRRCLQRQLPGDVGEHGLMAHDGPLFNVKNIGRIEHVRHRSHGPAKVPSLIDTMKLQASREVFRVMFVELRRPAGLVYCLCENTMIQTILMEKRI